MKKERTDSLEYIAKKHKQEQEEYLKAGVVKRVVHTAVSSGSWCGGQRQQCGDSGSGLR